MTDRTGRNVAPFAALALVAALLSAAPARAADIVLTETGSTLLLPLFDVMVPEFMKRHDGIQIKTAGSGSEDGELQAFSGQVTFGGSDAYMSDTQVRSNTDFVDIPLAISAQTINYNVPGLNQINLRLDGATIAGIYRGDIREWDAPAIAALNPGVQLPHLTIVPVHRGEGSGDTFVFSQFLSFSSPKWELDKDYGTTIDWPKVPGAIAATGNDGMEKTIEATPGAIGYLGISYADMAQAGKIGTAMLKNEAGQFVMPTDETIMAGAVALGVRTPADERLSLVYGPGERSYPLVNYEYVVVSTKQQDPAVAAAIRRFLLWMILPSEENGEYLERVHFVPLPPHIWELSQAQIQQIR
jgi:phosphate transport system substrate-binding protein